MRANSTRRSASALGLSIRGFSEKGGSSIGYSPDMKEFARKNRGAITAIHRLIRKNFSAIQKGKRLWEPENSIAIKRTLTGSYKGGSNDLRGRRKANFRVTVGSEKFFVKAVIGRAEAANVLRGIGLLDRWLGKRAHNVDGFKVEVIKPELIYERGKLFYLVTKFYSWKEVEQVLDMRGKEADRVMKALDFINAEFEKSGKHLREIDPKNAFYEGRTNTVYLYDIYAFLKPRNSRLLKKSEAKGQN